MLYKADPESACNQFFAVITAHAHRAFFKELSHSHFTAGKTKKGEMTYPRSHSRLCSVHSYYCCKLGSSSSSCYSHHSNKIQTIIIIFTAICTAVKAGGHNQDSAYVGSVQTSNQIQSLLQGACSLSRDIILWEHRKGGKERRRDGRQ